MFGVENGYAFLLCFDELGEEPCSTVCTPLAGTLAPLRVFFCSSSSSSNLYSIELSSYQKYVYDYLVIIYLNE